MPRLFSPTQCGLSDLKAGEACQKQAEAVPEKPATSRLFNARKTLKSIVQQAVGQLNNQKRASIHCPSLNRLTWAANTPQPDPPPSSPSPPNA